MLLQDNSVINTGLTPILFEKLPQGTYFVREVIPEGYEATGPTEYEFTVEDVHLFHNFTFDPFIIPEPEFHRNYQIVKGITTGNTIYPAASRNKIPSWNIFGRPLNPKSGLIGFNSQTNNLELWDGKLWLKLPMKKI